MAETKESILQSALHLFAQEGYEAVRAAAVDMFPGTANVETVVRLEPRKN